jgi:hypothetical protein
MLKLDTATYLVTQDNPAGPIIQFEDDGFEPQSAPVDGRGNVTYRGEAVYLLAYTVLAAFVGYMFIAV